VSKNIDYFSFGRHLPTKCTVSPPENGMIGTRPAHKVALTAEQSAATLHFVEKIAGAVRYGEDKAGNAAAADAWA
jgi:hypothetical protein